MKQQNEDAKLDVVDPSLYMFIRTIAYGTFIIGTIIICFVTYITSASLDESVGPAALYISIYAITVYLIRRATERTVLRRINRPKRQEVKHETSEEWGCFWPILVLAGLSGAMAMYFGMSQFGAAIMFGAVLVVCWSWWGPSR